MGVSAMRVVADSPLFNGDNILKVERFRTLARNGPDSSIERILIARGRVHYRYQLPSPLRLRDNEGRYPRFQQSRGINMSVLKEFKEFAIKGNVVDMAVGVVIGVAFGKIVTSFVSDVIMPPLGILIGGVDFKSMSLVLREAVEKKPPVTLNYGAFLQNIVDFLIVALAIFAVVKLINRLKKEPPPAVAAPPSAEAQLLGEIRDILRDGSALRPQNRDRV